MAATMKNARPVSSVVPSYARQFADDSRERSGSASSVPAMPTTTMNSGNMASSGQGVSHPNGQVPVPRDRPRQVSNDSLIGTPAVATHPYAICADRRPSSFDHTPAAIQACYNGTGHG